MNKAERAPISQPPERGRQYSFDEVLVGLRAGRKFRLVQHEDLPRPGFFNDRTVQFLSPMGGGSVHHEVVHNSRDPIVNGSGGANTMSIDELESLKGRWPQTGWKMVA